jgi:pyruvate/2-oxoglutarate dehydrogenase complex dihydrolipoamide acyltransferase (E2) component
MVIGHIGETEVRSLFDGVLQNFIAHAGERLAMREPVAWLRAQA